MRDSGSDTEFSPLKDAFTWITIVLGVMCMLLGSALYLQYFKGKELQKQIYELNNEISELEHKLTEANAKTIEVRSKKLLISYIILTKGSLLSIEVEYRSIMLQRKR